MPQPYDMRFWRSETINALETVGSFFKMSEIALDVLNRMADTGKEIHQICGPMSTGGLGNRARNMELFGHAIDIGEENGWLVFNQLPFQASMERLSKHSKEKYCNNILTDFYLPIFEVKIPRRTPFLPRWISSYGANWEGRLVITLPHIKPEAYPLTWYNHALERMGLHHSTIPPFNFD